MGNSSLNDHRDIYVKNIFNNIDDLGIPFCTWKNYHLHDNSSSINNNEYDLFIPLKYKNLFNNVLVKFEGIELHPPLHHFPNIFHYYFITDERVIVHFHVYHQLYTGESYTKDYLLPFGEDIIINRIKHKKLIYVSSESFENLITTLRIYLKVSSIPGILFFLLEKKDYIKQIDHMDINKGIPNIGNFISYSLILKCFNHIKDYNLLQKYFLGKFVRQQLNSYRRIPIYKSFFLQVRAISYGLLNKIRGKQKKLLKRGVFIAIVGSDGSGKSTMSSLLCSFIGSQIQSRQIHFGRPPATIPTLLFRILLKLNAVLKKSSQYKKKTNLNLKSFSLIQSIRYCILAYERYSLVRSTRKDLKLGKVIISDRFASVNIGVMDSPRLDIKYSNGPIKKLLARIENIIYKKIPKPDLILKLDVPVEELIKRNNMRNKNNKETDSDIMARYDQFKELQYDADEIYIVNSINEKKVTFECLAKKAWSKISKINRI